MEEIKITLERAELLLEDKDHEFKVSGQTASVYEEGVGRMLVLFERRDSNPSELYALLLEQENKNVECGNLLIPVEIEIVAVREVVPLKGRLMTPHRLLANRLIDRFPSIL